MLAGLTDEFRMNRGGPMDKDIEKRVLGNKIGFLIC